MLSKTYTNLLFVLILVSASLFTFTLADIPVHCRKEKIEGDWVFTVSDEKFTPSLSDAQTTCGHGFPDHIDQTIGDKDYHFHSSSTLKLTLGHDYKTYQDGAVVGAWTPIYDEGFIVYAKNMVLTGYMKYFKNEDGVFKSNCNKTMKGWLIPDKDHKTSNWSCFYGNKIAGQVCTKKSFLKKTHTLTTLKSLKSKSKDNFTEVKDEKLEEDGVGVGLLQIQTTESVHLIHNKYEDQAHIVEEINNMGLTWKAGLHEDFKGMSLFELNNHPTIGLNRNNYEKEEEEGKFTDNTLQQPSLLQVKTKGKKSTFEEDNKALNKVLASIKEDDKSKSSSETDSDSDLFNPTEMERKSKGVKEPDSHMVSKHEDITRYINDEVDNIDASILPKSWDWRNVGGKNFVPHQRHQGSCGSCYIFSTLSSLEARLRIQTNNEDKTEFSRQFIINCNHYTEGCKGGYPILVGKFANEYELMPDSCMPYMASNGECSSRCDPNQYKHKYQVSRYEYLGGFYGATSEELMMKEIRARGPMPGNISVPWSFSYYKGGIYANFNKEEKNNFGISKTTMFDRHVTWEKVDHSILIIGWGEENGIKYWICMNTWGEHWGEGGYFRILRGKNECSIETMGDVMRISKTVR